MFKVKKNYLENANLFQIVLAYVELTKKINKKFLIHKIKLHRFGKRTIILFLYSVIRKSYAVELYSIYGTKLNEDIRKQQKETLLNWLKG